MILQHFKTQFSQMGQKLPLGKFDIDDNAYVCSEILLTSFSGVEMMNQQWMHSIFI